MTEVNRRSVAVPRFQVIPIWDQVGNHRVWCVIDNTIRTWPRGVRPEGYADEQEASAVCTTLSAKAKQ